MYRLKITPYLRKFLLLYASILTLFAIAFSASFSYALGFQNPLHPGNWYLSQDFGVWNSNLGAYHLGEDYVVNDGSELPVYAVADGTVKHVQSHTDYGLSLIHI